jgi:peroxiredoxin
MNTLKKIAASFLMMTCISSIALAGYNVGDKVTDFKLKNVDGKTVSLADFKDAKGVIVIFTCNHCPYAQAYEQRIMELDKMYAAKGYPVVAINPNDPVAYPADSFEEMIKRSKEKSYSFPYLIDETQDIAKAFGAAKTPHVYLLTKNKDVYTVEYIGAIDDNSESAADVKAKYVENAIAELNSGKKVSVNSTKAIGCSIKWKGSK